MTTHEQLEQRITELTEKMSALQAEIENVKNELEQVDEWPKMGEDYYYISQNGKAWYNSWIYDETDKSRLSVGNVFRTCEEAEFAVERLKIFAEMRKFTTDKRLGEIPDVCTIVLNKYINSNCGNFVPVEYVVESSAPAMNYGILPLFETKNDALACIDAIGQERLKKYYFGVKDDVHGI